MNEFPNKHPRWQVRGKEESRKLPYEIIVQGKDFPVKIADVYNCSGSHIAILTMALREYFDNHPEEYEKC